MSDTPLSWTGSWVDLTADLSSGTVSPVVLGELGHGMRLLREAQAAGSSRPSPYISSTQSPKSPPNSPYNERVDGEEAEADLGLGDVYLNTETEVAISDFIWDWSSRPNIAPPKAWRRPGGSGGSSSKSSTKDSGVFSSSKRKTKFLYTVVITNILSLLLGAGIGVWMFRSSSQPETVITPV